MQLTLSTKPGTFSRGSTFTGAVSPTVAGSTPDGLYVIKKPRDGLRQESSSNTRSDSYIKMLANGVEGGTYTAYSERFTITGMTGTTPAEYVKAAAAGGIPTNINAIAKAAVPAPAAPAASLPVGANEYQIPYNQQSGTVRYAPMQKIPPTKITKNNPTPLFPPSAVVTAKTNLPLPTILTTVTEPQTFSVQSHANTVRLHGFSDMEPLTRILMCVQAAAQSQPTGDMARFLARWKD